MDQASLTSSSITSLTKIAEGKVRSLYEVDEDTLLFVASDRISAYDVIMKNGVPDKGCLLTLLSAHWFAVLPTLVPNLRTHFLTMDLPSAIPASQRALLRNRSMQVRKLKIFPLEAIVRGYLTGSAFQEYQRTSTVHGIKIAPGLKQCEPFPQGAIYTPSTKAEAGSNDENIHPSKAAEIVGEKYAKRIEELSLKLYTAARDYAYEKGLIIADTKFEFGLDEATDEIVLVDEVLTPDSSRFWSKETYQVGRDQDSFDKQFLRNWLTREGLKGKLGVSMPEDIVKETRAKYVQAFEKLSGNSFQEALGV